MAFSWPSTACLKAGSSLRNRMAMGSDCSEVPASLYSFGSRELATTPASRLSSSTKAAARPFSTDIRLSRLSFCCATLILMSRSRSSRRSSCTAVVPVVAETVLPSSCFQSVMPESARTAMRTWLR